MPTWDFVCNRCESLVSIHVKKELLPTRHSVDPEIFMCPECGCDEVKITSFENTDDYPQHLVRAKMEDLEYRLKKLEEALEYEYPNNVERH